MAGRPCEKDWFSLDNAAKIYPATASPRSPAEFRMTFTVKEPVRLIWLEAAAERVMPRFPCCQVLLKKGFFWYYLQRKDLTPGISPMVNTPLGMPSERGHSTRLLRICAAGATVAVDFSHILTDGTGGMAFLLALAAMYLREAGLLERTPPGVMNPDEEPSPEEFEDAHRRYFPDISIPPERMKPAWHLPGEPMEQGRIRVLSGSVPVEDVHARAGEKGVSITEYLAAVYLHSLAEIHPGRGRSIIRMEIPLDMRRVFPSSTMRNFSLYLSPEIDLALGEWTFDETVTEIHHRMGLMKSRKQLGRQLYRNVGSEFNPLVRYLPRSLKDMVLSFSYSRLGEGLHSGVISNLGRVQVPEEMAGNIDSLGMMIRPNHVMKKSCSILSFGGMLDITFASVIEDVTLEKLFFRFLAGSGADITVREIQ